MIYKIKLISQKENHFYWQNSNLFIVDDKLHFCFSDFFITDRNSIGKSILVEMYYGKKEIEVNNEMLEIILSYLILDCKAIITHGDIHSISFSFSDDLKNIFQTKKEKTHDVIFVQ